MRALTNDLREAAWLGSAGILLSAALHVGTFVSLASVRVVMTNQRDEVMAHGDAEIRLPEFA